MLKFSLVILWLVIVADIGRPRAAWATVGMAEWAVTTPGTNVICHADPFITQHGTCLRPADKAPGVVVADTVYVARIEWWQYFPGHVVGKAQKGFFVFNESSKTVVHSDTEAALKKQLKALAIGSPLTRRLTPQDGWQLTWGLAMRQRLEQLKKSEKYKAMSDGQKQALERQFESYKVPDIRPTSP